MPDVAEALNLEEIDLEGCIQLRKLSPSIGFLRKLTILNLENCKNLVSLPNSILGLNSLEYLNVSGCSNLFNNELLDQARNTEHLEKLCLVKGLIHSHSTSPSIKKMLWWTLDLLYSRAQRESVSCLLPSSPTLPCLRELDLRFCNLVTIPDAIGKLRCLEKLNLKGNNFVTLPNLKNLFRLYYLNLQHCKHLKYLPDLPSRIHLPLKVYEISREYFASVYIFTLEEDEEKAGLLIFNCPEIVERKRCTSMSVSWMLQIVQAKCLTFTLFHPSVESIIPGSEIPMWFNNQLVSMDNSIIIDASPIMHDNNWVGVVCCIIFSVGISGKLNFPRTRFRVRKIPVDLRRVLSVDHSDHMWLFYLSRQEFLWKERKFRDTLDTCDFRLKFTIQKPIRIENTDTESKYFVFEVKKYGYRWVNEQDLQLSNLAMIHG